ncbi:hypothetical protein ACHWQZ_G013586, partial [Mnemiopsis leidyi]
MWCSLDCVGVRELEPAKPAKMWPSHPHKDAKAGHPHEGVVPLVKRRPAYCSPIFIKRAKVTKVAKVANVTCNSLDEAG